VVDDERDFADLVVRVAGQLGYQAEAASTAAAFQACYLAAVPDVIVLDIVMPDQDGIELMRWLVG
jgi:CheY-like chemotaxis protein